MSFQGRDPHQSTDRGGTVLHVLRNGKFVPSLAALGSLNATSAGVDSSQASGGPGGLYPRGILPSASGRQVGLQNDALPQRTDSMWERRESDDGALRVDFDRHLRLEFHGARITSTGCADLA